MQEVETLSSVLWWVFPLVLLCAAGCFVEGLQHAWMRVVVSRSRNVGGQNRQLAEFLAQVKPPPYGLYAVCWIATGMLLLVAAFKIWY
ncbi:hypothetical protein GCM10007320_65800 [Pseudorhodoferax aquiterrae]|uniref:Uncharacterized protein n=1 Tax=Pseudorhodoferax aquiterrae TaxID=747304 RepID=A0ABQ3GFV0_9BURK|nr:hypothetical protein [Pseudorhodoferax aquiterrae]GHD04693.1 hypothetical protein GCM10007320_65800 [Pseudorhodoferax aquiterrae]